MSNFSPRENAVDEAGGVSSGRRRAPTVGVSVSNPRLRRQLGREHPATKEISSTGKGGVDVAMAPPGRLRSGESWPFRISSMVFEPVEMQLRTRPMRCTIPCLHVRGPSTTDRKGRPDTFESVQLRIALDHVDPWPLTRRSVGLIGRPTSIARPGPTMVDAARSTPTGRRWATNGGFISPILSPYSLDGQCQ
jgi:hypothetical protein